MNSYLDNKNLNLENLGFSKEIYPAEEGITFIYWERQLTEEMKLLISTSICDKKRISTTTEIAINGMYELTPIDNIYDLYFFLSKFPIKDASPVATNQYQFFNILKDFGSPIIHSYTPIFSCITIRNFTNEISKLGRFAKSYALITGGHNIIKNFQIDLNGTLKLTVIKQKPL